MARVPAVVVAASAGCTADAVAAVGSRCHRPRGPGHTPRVHMIAERAGRPGAATHVHVVTGRVQHQPVRWPVTRTWHTVPVHGRVLGDPVPRVRVPVPRAVPVRRWPHVQTGRRGVPARHGASLPRPLRTGHRPRASRARWSLDRDSCA